ncbi:MAG: DNA-processing protein DprA [Clostridia bacterium]|nr:DNA-processing protein DprA [Clostridia bacterium]
MNEKILRLWLASKTGRAAWRAEQLQSYFGSLEAVYEAKLDDYMQLPEMKKSVAIALSDKSLAREEKIVSDCKEFGINILTPEDKGFNQTLTQISTPVQVIYTLGEIPDWDSILGIAIVGTRKFSEYGQVAAERLSSELAEAGVTIISGMARGIDSFALRSAVRAGMPSVAVMGCGLDQAYPPENRGLMNDIIKTGCAISEYPPCSPPIPQHFPARNRIVSGLSDGVLAIEAPIKSGTLITTRLAADMGKTLFAVPGNIFAKNSAGTNELIKQGAIPVTCAQDILEAFSIKSKNLTPPTALPEKEAQPVKEDIIEGLSEKENLIITLLRQKDMHIEEIAARGGFTIAELNGMLTMLEIEGYILKTAGSIYKCNLEK